MMMAIRQKILTPRLPHFKVTQIIIIIVTPTVSGVLRTVPKGQEETKGKR